MEDFIINNQTVSAGTCKQIVLNSYELHTKTKVEIPVFIFRSKIKGPTLLLCAGMHGEEGDHAKIEDKGSLTEQLDTMLEDAKIGPELMTSLGEGLRSLSDQAGKLNNITDASVATEGYVSSVKSAAKNVDSLSESYSKAAESLNGLSLSNADSATFGEQISKVAKNLSALNASYELQLQGSGEHLKATSRFYGGLENLMQNLNDSVDDTKKYKEQIAQLSSNLESLNTIYGNMLTAMRK